jgi:hypothetical protein
MFEREKMVEEKYKLWSTYAGHDPLPSHAQDAGMQI